MEWDVINTATGEIIGSVPDNYHTTPRHCSNSLAQPTPSGEPAGKACAASFPGYGACVLPEHKTGKHKSASGYRFTVPRDTTAELANQILNSLVNLSTVHLMEAETTFPAAIFTARAVNYGAVERVSTHGRTVMVIARDALRIWVEQQYGMSPRRASSHALLRDWPTEY